MRLKPSAAARSRFAAFTGQMPHVPRCGRCWSEQCEKITLERLHKHDAVSGRERSVRSTITVHAVPALANSSTNTNRRAKQTGRADSDSHASCGPTSRHARAFSEKVWPFSKFQVPSSEFRVQPAAGAVRIRNDAVKSWGRCAGPNLELGTWNSELRTQNQKKAATLFVEPL
jgi:hypothetical protein